MARSTIFMNNRTQAVRIPKELAFPDSVKEVEIVRDGGGLLIVPKGGRAWRDYLASPSRLSADFPDDIDDTPPEAVASFDD
jgi:antitoxin VapB